MPTKLSLFTQHSRSWQNNAYVYPVISRRSKGLSIGINLNPDKACNFDCIYCSVDRATPAQIRRVDLHRVEAELDHLLDLTVGGRLFEQPPFDKAPTELRRLNDIAFSGDGEPTSYSKFPETCVLAAEALDRHGLAGKARLVLITNATLFHRPKVAEALRFLDAHHGEIWAKLDAGTEAYYQLIERTKIPLAKVLQNIAEAGRRRPIVIQSLFMNVHGEPPAAAEIDAYVARLVELCDAGCMIQLVQVYTVARATAEAYVTSLPDEALDAIAEKVRGIPLAVETYYGPG